MPLFQSVLLLLSAAVALSALGRKIRVPYPVLLAIAGAALAFAPVGPSFTLDPELALALFVAPVLLDAAFDTSLRDLKNHWLPLAGLVFVAVGLTIALVAVVARCILPSLPWSAAIALGAIVAPPDAAAASAVLRQVRLPHPIVVVLEGESLLNDAAALLIYRIAVGATMAGTALLSQPIAPVFLVAVVGSLVAGPTLSHAMAWLMSRVEDIPSRIVMQFVATFGVWLFAEHFGLSPILTVVAYAITAARTAPGRTSARLRTPSYAVWDTVVLVLNALAFVVVGLQLRPILEHDPTDKLGLGLAFAGAVLAIVIGARFAWVYASSAVSAALARRRGGEATPPGATPRWKRDLVVSWCGMRGIVTLATALALPEGFPDRDLMLLTAFAVTFGTLVLQGATLRPLLHWLALPADGLVDAEVRAARIQLADVALDQLAREERPEAAMMRSEFELQREAARSASAGEGRATSVKKEILRRTLTARRARLLHLRRDGVIGDEAFHRLEAELDVAELAAGG